jgi:hypothetical protein
MNDQKTDVKANLVTETNGENWLKQKGMSGAGDVLFYFL